MRSSNLVVVLLACLVAGASPEEGCSAPPTTKSGIPCGEPDTDPCPVSCSGHADYAVCTADEGCLWLEPIECMADAIAPVAVAGCFARNSCVNDAECQNDETCVHPSSERCDDGGCEWLCGTTVGTCSATVSADLCTDSGGSWSTSQCGNAWCGMWSADTCVLPGCNCGEGRNFVDGEGCAADPACDPACDEDADCAAGSTCIMLECVGCLPYCEPLTCFDSVCPEGSRCSSEERPQPPSAESADVPACPPEVCGDELPICLPINE
jgi:hypothetical protein